MYMMSSINSNVNCDHVIFKFDCTIVMLLALHVIINVCDVLNDVIFKFDSTTQIIICMNN